MAESYPRRFGKYVLVAPLAKGGMGELHLAFSGRAELKKLCVIKTILGHLADEEFTARFVDEAKVVVKLSHGNLIPVLEAGQVEGQFFLAMEYIDGKDLRDVWTRHLEQGKPFPLDVALYVVREICRGLSYVHTYGDLHLVHRDVSPPNVLLSYTGEVRLTDFGVATSTIKLQKTAPGILLGKLSYMSPEQARNERVDSRADIYSLGVILWELLTGKRLAPPEGSQLERYERAVHPKPEPPSRYNPEVLAEMDLITLRALAPDRSKRYPDAEEMRKDLSTLLGKLSPAIDGSAVQELLEQLYGRERLAEQAQRHQLLEAVATRAQELMTDSRIASGSEKTDAARSPVGSKVLESLTEDEDYEDEDFGASPSSPCLQQGTLLGKRYRIEELLGEGGMGRVYLATHTEIDKKVAVKVLHPSYGRMPDLVSRFRREARAASRIGHPHIVEVYDSGRTPDGSIYFVMEYLTGIDLADVLSSEGKLEIERAIRLSIQVCEAVAAAHEAGIIHRDLKPENIFLTTRGGSPDFVKVLDFGLAQNIGLEETRQERLTNPGMAMGTPEYMAPEQAAGKSTDHRADIYSVGTLTYEMLVGNPPHVGDNIMEVFSRKAVEPIVPPSELRPEVWPELERVVMWALEKNPEDRPQTMAQLSYELNKLMRGRAGAVASLLGLPSLPSVASAQQRLAESSERGEEGAYSEQGYTAHVANRIPGSRSALRWALLGAVLVIGGLWGGMWLIKAMGLPPERLTSVLDAFSGPGRPADAAQARDAGRPAPDVERPRAPDAALPRAGGGRNHPRGPRPAGGALALGRRHLLAGRFDAARVAFQQALRSRRDRVPAQVGLAEVEFQRGSFEAARQHAIKAVAQGGGWRAQLVLANVYYRLGQYPRAIRLYEAVLASQPSQPEARRNLAAARRRMNP